MQMVTPLSSAIFFTRLRPMMVFLAPSSSDMPARFPENVITFGTPAFAASGMFLRKPSSILAWFSTRLARCQSRRLRLSHTANQTVTPRYFVFIRIQQVDGLQTNLRRIDTEFFDWIFFVTPPGNRLLDLA